jgi:hypothetical protein
VLVEQVKPVAPPKEEQVLRILPVSWLEGVDTPEFKQDFGTQAK